MKKKVTIIVLKERDIDKLYKEIDARHSIICMIGSDFTTNELAESAVELAKEKVIFGRAEKAESDSEISWTIFTRQPLKPNISKAIARFYNHNSSDDGKEYYVEANILKTLLSRKRYTQMVGG